MRERGELVDREPEQLVARVRLEDVREGAAVVAVGREARLGDHRATLRRTTGMSRSTLSL